MIFELKKNKISIALGKKLWHTMGADGNVFTNSQTT